MRIQFVLDVWCNTLYGFDHFIFFLSVCSIVVFKWTLNIELAPNTIKLSKHCNVNQQIQNLERKSLLQCVQTTERRESTIIWLQLWFILLLLLQYELIKSVETKEKREGKWKKRSEKTLPMKHVDALLLQARWQANNRPCNYSIF